MKKLLKKTGIVLLVIFVIIQFFRPEKNTAGSPAKNNIATAFTVSPEINKLLTTSCNDCHTGTTHYPWYAEIQPVGWWLNHHVEEGKGELDFDNFAAYSPRRQYHKFEEIIEMLQEKEMPLESYTLIHGDAELNDTQRKTLVSWAEAMMDTMKAHYPADSLKRPSR